MSCSKTVCQAHNATLNNDIVYPCFIPSYYMESVVAPSIFNNVNIFKRPFDADLSMRIKMSSIYKFTWMIGNFTVHWTSFTICPRSRRTWRSPNKSFIGADEFHWISYANTYNENDIIMNVIRCIHSLDVNTCYLFLDFIKLTDFWT